MREIAAIRSGRLGEALAEGTQQAAARPSHLRGRDAGRDRLWQPREHGCRL